MQNQSEVDRATIDGLTSQIASLEASLEQSVEEKKNLSAQFSQIKAEQDALKEKNAALEQKHNSLEAQLYTVEKRLKESEDHNADLTALLAQNEADRVSLIAEKASLGQKHKDLVQNYKELEKNNGLLKMQKEEADLLIDNLNSLTKILEGTMKLISNHVIDMLSRVSSLEEELFIDTLVVIQNPDLFLILIRFIYY